MSESARIFPFGRQALEPKALEPQALEPLWREVLGSRLRALRTDRDRIFTARTALDYGLIDQVLTGR